MVISCVHNLNRFPLFNSTCTGDEVGSSGTNLLSFAEVPLAATVEHDLFSPSSEEIGSSNTAWSSNYTIKDENYYFIYL